MRALSPIVPLMYLDSVSDGILKGLDQQAFSFRTAITDSTLRIILILIILPVSGLRGFIWIMYFSNLLTCALNVGRLIKVSKARLKPINEVLLPLGAAFAITLLSNMLIRLIPNINNLAYLILICIISLPLYLLFIFLFGTVTADDVKDILKR